MISYAKWIAAACLLLAACANYVGFEYRVAAKDPKVNSAKMLSVVTLVLDRAEAKAKSWAQIDEKSGEVTFGLGAYGSGKTPSIRDTETRVLSALRYEFGDRVEVFCDGEPLR